MRSPLQLSTLLLFTSCANSLAQIGGLGGLGVGLTGGITPPSVSSSIASLIPEVTPGANNDKSFNLPYTGADGLVSTILIQRCGTPGPSDALRTILAGLNTGNLSTDGSIGINIGSGTGVSLGASIGLAGVQASVEGRVVKTSSSSKQSAHKTSSTKAASVTTKAKTTVKTTTRKSSSVKKSSTKTKSTHSTPTSTKLKRFLLGRAARVTAAASSTSTSSAKTSVKASTTLSTKAASTGAAAAAASASITVDLYMHVVVTTDQARYWGPGIRANALAAQAKAMQDAYAPSGIAFTVKQASYTIRNDWATDANSTDMKKALRQGDYEDLNIYFQSNLSSDPGSSSFLLGYCTLPTTVTFQYAGNTYEYPQSAWAIDGCNILASTMPGAPSSLYGYAQGKTAVHESGHWFGLLHTFQDNTCDASANGDYISDTPQERDNTDGCPADRPGKDSCPGLPGLDPIHNYMDYSDDGCYTGFTAGQTKRMSDLYTQMRQGH